MTALCPNAVHLEKEELHTGELRRSSRCEKYASKIIAYKNREMADVAAAEVN